MDKTINKIYKMNIVALQSTISFKPGKNISSVKVCKNCKNYVANGERCKLFGNMNIVTGYKEYNMASFERSQSGNCGPEGKFYNATISTDDKPNE